MATGRTKVTAKKARVASATTPPRKSSRLSDQAVKRKATEDVSPSSTKKRKPVEKPAKEEAVTGPVKQKKAKTENTTEKAAKPQPKAASKPAKKKANGKAASKEVVDDEENDEGSEDEEDDTTKALVEEIGGGGSGDENDVDEEAGGASLFKPGQDVGKAPVTAALKKSAAKNKAKTKASNGAVTETAAAEAAQPAKINGSTSGSAPPSEVGGVVYVGRIPHGFFEHEMRSYFAQFGAITRLRLSRNPRTGASKHYAFIEFADPEVAGIVAQTMDNYLLFGHLLRCRVVPTERIPPNLFKGANRRFKAVPWNRMAGHQLAQPKSEADWADKIKNESKRRARRAAALENKLGYTFAAPSLKTVDAVERIAGAAEEEGSTTDITEAKQLENGKAAEEDTKGDDTDATAAAAEATKTNEAEVVPAGTKASKAGKKGKGKKNKA
ncbi:ribosomal biogenesis protein gar2 [Niveomyces insectorum RCEF 264]|uniref:Ribosomal biogenesis protein gar2 n=1 Tax=Niveomyces insectorum RCEF 264 TaxID=1081102 RepID=A0A167Z952_9HYPO|nr:ribosomal biogenesis protein gar2 [Niveomyces insectorum RCEF 264]